MKPMANHSSATVRETPHATQTTQITISDALRRRARSVINDRFIDPEWRKIIRYALEINDPWLADLVRRADSGERIFDAIDFSLEPETNVDDSSEDKIEALVELICRAGDEPETKSAALLVLMSTLENATHPKVLANTAKHLAFNRCGDLNLLGMVDAQIAMLEGELLAGNTLVS
jgi:hypothetical protein